MFQAWLHEGVSRVRETRIEAIGFVDLGAHLNHNMIEIGAPPHDDRAFDQEPIMKYIISARNVEHGDREFGIDVGRHRFAVLVDLVPVQQLFRFLLLNVGRGDLARSACHLLNERSTSPRNRPAYFSPMPLGCCSNSSAMISSTDMPFDAKCQTQA